MSTETILFLVYLGIQILLVLYGMLAWSRIAKNYRPMLVFTWVVFLMLSVESLLPVGKDIEQAAGYLEPLIVLLLIAWQAKQWRLFQSRPAVFWIIVIMAIAGWIVERLLATGVPGNDSWFGVAASFTIILLAIEMLGSTMINSPGLLFRNSIFLFSVALIFFYTFSGLLDLFSIVARDSGDGILYKAYYFYITLGILTNIIYLKSFKCIPQKNNYSIS